MRLLIVDDNANWRKFLRNEFKQIFSEIFECEDGSQALTTYELNKPEWVFMDIKMEKMDGLKTTKQILSHYPLAKIILVTSYDNNEFRDAARNSGAKDYILKDEIDRIFEIINNNIKI